MGSYQPFFTPITIPFAWISTWAIQMSFHDRHEWIWISFNEPVGPGLIFLQVSHQNRFPTLVTRISAPFTVTELNVVRGLSNNMWQFFWLILDPSPMWHLLIMAYPIPPCMIWNFFAIQNSIAFSRLSVVKFHSKTIQKWHVTLWLIHSIPHVP